MNHDASAETAFHQEKPSSLLPFPASIESLLSFLYLEDFAALVVAALAQAWWGSLRSWQFGHSESPVAVSASCARRLEVRALDGAASDSA